MSISEEIKNMTITEMLDKLKELYRRDADHRYAQYEINDEIQKIRNQLINSVKQYKHEL